MKHLLLLLLLATMAIPAMAQSKKFPEIGITEGMSNDSLVAAAGYGYLVESVQRLLSPKSVTEDQFTKNLERIKRMHTRLYALNVLIPGDLKLTGPTVDEQSILAYAEEVFKRCERAGVKLVVWGSGGARRVPEGYDAAQAKAQFISLAGKVAAVAKKYEVVMALENLNSTETNFINTVAEALDVVKKVNHPNFRLCVDIYHMLKENEAPAIIEQTKPYLVHCDIAEKDSRTPPGTQGDDIMPYLKALKKVNYHGKVILECRWNNLAVQAQPAFVYLQKELEKAYSQ